MLRVVDPAQPDELPVAFQRALILSGLVDGEKWMPHKDANQAMLQFLKAFVDARYKGDLRFSCSISKESHDNRREGEKWGELFLLIEPEEMTAIDIKAVSERLAQIDPGLPITLLDALANKAPFEFRTVQDIQQNMVDWFEMDQADGEDAGNTQRLPEELVAMVEAPALSKNALQAIRSTHPRIETFCRLAENRDKRKLQFHHSLTDNQEALQNIHDHCYWLPGAIPIWTENDMLFNYIDDEWQNYQQAGDPANPFFLRQFDGRDPKHWKKCFADLDLYLRRLQAWEDCWNAWKAMEKGTL